MAYLSPHNQTKRRGGMREAEADFGLVREAFTERRLSQEPERSEVGVLFSEGRGRKRPVVERVFGICYLVIRGGVE